MQQQGAGDQALLAVRGGAYRRAALGPYLTVIDQRARPGSYASVGQVRPLLPRQLRRRRMRAVWLIWVRSEVGPV